MTSGKNSDKIAGSLIILTDDHFFTFIVTNWTLCSRLLGNSMNAKLEGVSPSNSIVRFVRYSGIRKFSKKQAVYNNLQHTFNFSSHHEMAFYLMIPVYKCHYYTHCTCGIAHFVRRFA